MTQQNEAIRLAVESLHQKPVYSTYERQCGYLDALNDVKVAVYPLLDQTSAGVGDAETLSALNNIWKRLMDCRDMAGYGGDTLMHHDPDFERVSRALTQADQQADKGGWLPIETVPKDGTVVILKGGVLRCESDDGNGDRPNFVNGVEASYISNLEIWEVEIPTFSQCYSVVSPTHWLPLQTRALTQADQPADKDERLEMLACIRDLAECDKNLTNMGAGAQLRTACIKHAALIEHAARALSGSDGRE